MTEATQNSSNISQQVIFASIVLIGQNLYPNQSVQQNTKLLYQTIFYKELFQPYQNKQNNDQLFEILQYHYETNHEEQENIERNRIQQEIENLRNLRNSRQNQYQHQIGEQYEHQHQSNYRNLQSNIQQKNNLISNNNRISNDSPLITFNLPTPQPSPLMHQFNPLSHSQAHSNQSYIHASSLQPFKGDLAKLPFQQKVQLLKKIKIQGGTPEQQQRIKRMKLNAFKATSRHYKHMKCQLIEIQMEQENNQDENSIMGKSKVSDGEKQKEKEKLKQKIKKLNKSKKNDQNHEKDQLKDWFDKEQDVNQQKYLENLDTFTQDNKNKKDNYFLQQQQQNPNPNNLTSSRAQRQTQQFTAQQLREHYQISKQLCIYTDKYSLQAMKTQDPLDDPQFVPKYFNFPDFAKQDKIQLQTFKDHFLMRLQKAIQCIKIFMKYGYGTRIYRKVHPQDKQMVKDKYGNYIWFGMRMAFRQMQNYLIKHCGKKIPILTYTQLYLISLTFYRIREMYTERSKQTWFGILKAAFRMESIVHVTKNDLYHFYNEMRKRLVERRDAIQNKLTLTIDKENQFAVKYHNYSEDGEIDFFGLDNGIEGIKNVFESENQIARFTKKHKRALKAWSEQFQLEFFKLYMQFRKLGQVRKHLLKRFKGPIYETQFNLKNSLNFRMQRLTRKAIQFIQGQFRRYCQMMDIKQLNFYQKKYLTLNFSQMRVIAINQQGIDCRLLIYDYYLNNKYGKNRHDQSNISLIKYRLTYINYMIQSMAQLLQHKKKLSDVLNQPEQDRFKMYDLQRIKGKKWAATNKDVIQLEQEDRCVHQFIVSQLEKVRIYWAERGFRSLEELERQVKMIKWEGDVKKAKEQDQNGWVIPKVKKENSQKAHSLTANGKRRGRPPKYQQTLDSYFIHHQDQVKVQHINEQNNQTSTQAQRNQQTHQQTHQQTQQQIHPQTTQTNQKNRQDQDWQQIYLQQNSQQQQTQHNQTESQNDF